MTDDGCGRFAGRVALVIGASKGIGAATHGAAVNHHHDGDAAAKVIHDIYTGGGQATALQADIAVAAVAAACTVLRPIDVLILNASGIELPAMAPFLSPPARPALVVGHAELFGRGPAGGRAAPRRGGRAPPRPVPTGLR